MWRLYKYVCGHVFPKASCSAELSITRAFVIPLVNVFGCRIVLSTAIFRLVYINIQYQKRFIYRNVAEFSNLIYSFMIF